MEVNDHMNVLMNCRS